MKTLKQRIAVLAAVATLALAGAAFADDAAAPDGFSVSLPDGYAAFTKQVQTSKAADGEITTANWISKAPTGEAVIVTVSTMPGKIVDPQKLIASTRDSLLKALGATIENDQAIDAASSNLAFKSASAVFRARVAVSDDRLYQLLYVGRSDEQRTAPAVATLFDSFHVNAPAQLAATPVAAPATSN